MDTFADLDESLYFKLKAMEKNKHSKMKPEEKHDASRSKGDKYLKLKSEDDIQQSKSTKSSPSCPRKQIPTSRKSRTRTSPRSKGKAISSTKSRDDTNKIEHSVSETVEEEFAVAVLEREEHRYGWGRFKPCWLQCCKRPFVALAVICFCGFTRTFGVHGIFPGAGRHLQTRFHFSNSDFAMIRMMFDIGLLVALLPIMYFASHDVNRPMWIGAGQLTMGFGSLLTTLPHILAPQADVGGVSHDTCLPMTTLTKQCVDTSSRNYKFLFMTALFIYGVGVTPCYTMGLTYLDENVSHRMSAVFTGTYAMCDLLGAVFGYLANYVFTRIPGDVSDSGTSITNPSDPTFYGAWWIGMVLCALMAWFSAIFAFGFPNKLPNALKIQLERTKERMSKKQRYPHAIISGKDDATGLRRVFRRCLDVLRLPAFSGLVVYNFSISYVIASFAAFMPPYLSIVFRIPLFEAVLWGAGVIVVCTLSLIAGTVIQYYLHLDLSGNVKLLLITNMSCLLFVFAFLISCPTSRMAGVNDAYPVYSNKQMTGNSDPLVDTCNSRCTCQTPQSDHFDPACFLGTKACGQLKGRQCVINLFSKCYAGCATFNDSHGTNCSCIPKIPWTNGTGVEVWASGGSVTRGLCQTRSGCPIQKLLAFMVGLFWICITLYIPRNAVMQLLIRCVPFTHREISLSISEVFVRLFTIISAPVYGQIMQAGCLAQKHNCGESICVWYDTEKLKFGTLLNAMSSLLVALIGMLLTLWTHKQIKVTSSIHQI